MVELKRNEPCLSCKLTSVLCLLSIGSYLVYRGKQQSPMARYTLYSLGTGSIGLGVGEIFDKSPFRE